MSGTPPEERIVPTVPNRLLGDVNEGDTLPDAVVRRHRDDRRARCAREPRLAPDAPRLRLRGQPQRHPQHLPQHAEPGRVVRALRDRLVRAEGPARAHEVPYEGLRLPRTTRCTSTPSSRRVETDDTGCGWVSLLVTLSVDGDPKTDCSVRIALPTSDDDNPWARRGDQWRP